VFVCLSAIVFTLFIVLYHLFVIGIIQLTLLYLYTGRLTWFLVEPVQRKATGNACQRVRYISNNVGKQVTLIYRIIHITTIIKLTAKNMSTK
jgi:hypothetical protein